MHLFVWVVKLVKTIVGILVDILAFGLNIVSGLLSIFMIISLVVLMYKLVVLMYKTKKFCTRVCWALQLCFPLLFVAFIALSK
jgi:hypothetical protein